MPTIQETIKKQMQSKVHLINAVRHAALWITAPFCDKEILNPNCTLNKEDIAKNGISIICIHGTADTVVAFKLVATRLLKDLPDNVVSIHLISFDERFFYGKSIDFFAQQLCQQLMDKKLLNVFLMGHSRGGLVAAWFAEYLAKSANITVLGIVPICSPFGGSELAITPLTLISQSVNQMQVGTDFLKRLVTKIARSSYKYYFVAAENDWIVSVAASYVEENCSSLMIFDRHGHLSLMSSHRLVQHIKICLNAAIKAHFEYRHQAVPAVIADAPDVSGEGEIGDEPQLRNQELPSALADMFYEVDAHVLQLKKDNYFLGFPTLLPDLQKYVSMTKTDLDFYKNLRGYLKLMLADIRGDKYPHAQSAGEFMLALHNEEPQKSTTSGWLAFKPPTLLKSFFLSKSGPQSATWREDLFFKYLLNKYKDVSLPKSQLEIEEKVTNLSLLKK